MTSSISKPSIVAAMLDHLHLEPGMRVLEIGTGSGWNAALLARRVGEANVTTIEVDAELAAHARRGWPTPGSHSPWSPVTGRPDARGTHRTTALSPQPGEATDRVVTGS